MTFPFVCLQIILDEKFFILFQFPLFYFFLECSRISSTLNSLIKSRYPQYSVRCLDDGSFDPMHCVDDKCICLNSTDGTVTKNKIYNVNNGSGGGNGNSNSYGSADNNYGKNNVGATISIADFNKLPCCKY